MLKLKKNVVEMLKTFVKPEELDETVKILERVMRSEHIQNFDEFLYKFNDSQSTRHVEMSFTIADFKEVEELKPYKWYPREMYDGNPKSYLIIETHEGDWTDCYANEQSELIPETTHFMYIEPLEEEDEGL